MRRAVPVVWRVLSEQCRRWRIPFFSLHGYARFGRRAITAPHLAANDAAMGQGA